MTDIPTFKVQIILRRKHIEEHYLSQQGTYQNIESERDAATH